MIRRLLLTTLIVAFSVTTLTAQTFTWADNGGALYYDYGTAVEALDDGSFLSVGYWYSYNAGLTIGDATWSSNSNSIMGSYILKSDESGNNDWYTQIWGNGNGTVSYGYAFAHDVQAGGPNNDFVVGGDYLYGIVLGSTGTSSPTTNSYDGFVGKYDSTGVLDWYKAFKGPGSDQVSSVSIDDSGSVYVHGRFIQSITIDTVTLYNSTSSSTAIEHFVAKFSNDGDLLWLRHVEMGGSVGYSYLNFPTYAYRFGAIANLSPSEDNDVIIAGSFLTFASIGNDSVTTNGSYDSFIARLNSSDGSVEWIQNGGGTSYDWPNEIAVDENDNFYVGGLGVNTIEYDGQYQTTSGWKGFVAKFDDAGDCDWVIATSATSTTYGNAITSVEVDNEGGLYVGGRFSGTLTLGSNSLIGGSSSTLFAARYDLGSSTWDWISGPTNPYSNSSNNGIRDIAAFGENNLFTTGYMFDDMQLGLTELENGSSFSSYADAFIARIADCSGLDVSAATSSGSLGFCQGENVTLLSDTDSLYEYQWYYNNFALGGEINSSYTTSTAGNYYMVVDSAGCIDTSNSLAITQFASPNVTHTNFSPVCNSVDPFVLTGGSPSGGTYSGFGVIGGDTFDPGYFTSGGTASITYSYTNSNGCTDSVTKSMVIQNSPSMFTAFPINKCENDAPVSLSGYGVPSGGTYSGNGVSSNVFNPSVAGPGTHYIYYTVSGCTSSDSLQANVTAAPSVSLTTSADTACNTSTSPLVLFGSPSGGTYDWNNINSQLFFPYLAGGPGNIEITYTVTSSGCAATDTAYIYLDSPLTMSIATLPDLCESDAALTLTPYGTPSGGTWSGTGVSGNTFDPGVSSTGTFTLTYSKTNVCGTYTDTESIDVNSNPTVSVTSSNVSCNGGSDGSATASGTGGATPYGYAWSNSATTATATGLTAGTYTVVITDANGCSDSTTVTITEPTALSLSTSSNPASCNGASDGAMSVSVSGGTTPYSYAWSNLASSAIVTGVAAGTYTVTVTDGNGCTETATVTVTEPTAVAASIGSVSNVSCNGGSNGSATASASGGTSPYSYAWSGGAGSSATATGLSAGTYTVTVTDANGCTDTESITITQPTVLVANIGSSSNVSCNGGSDGSATASGSGGTSPYSYAWSGGGGSSATATGLSAGTYTVTVTDANGCTDTESVTITQPATAVSVSISSSSDVSCNGGSDGSATASGSGGTGSITYAWSGGGGSSATAAGLSAGTYTVTATDANGCTATTTVTINQPTAVVASISVNQNASCNGGSDGSATASASGGTSPYSYAWSGGGGSSATATGLSAGTYTVTATDANGCTDTETVTITQPTAVAASISSSTNVSCNGGSDGSATASGTGGTSPYTYAWSGGGGSSATATGLSAGTYTVTVTDDNGCTDTETVTITQPSTLVANIGTSSNVSCNGGSDGTATATGSGGTSPYAYAWSGGGGSSATATGLSAGTYTVTITDANGCTDTESITITQPATAVSVSISSSTDVSCNGGSDGSATASASGGTGSISYAWSGGGGSSATATGLAAGTYTVTATDANGCTATTSVTISQPSAVVASISVNQNVSCNGGGDGSATASGSGGTSPYSYAWSGGGGSSATATGLSVGTYTVTVTDANGCTDTETVTITQPTAVIASISSSNVSCNGGSDGSATASGSGGTSPYTFAWSTTASTATISGLSAGTYTVTVTDANGCTDIESITITQPAVAAASITSSTNVSCNGGSDGSATAAGSGGTSPYSYAWSGGGGSSATATGLSAGTYTVTVTDANGCTSTASVTITEPATAVSAAIASSSNVSCNGGNDGSATATGSGGTSPYSYAWSGGGGSSATATGLSAGTYTVTVTGANGCTDTESVTISEPSVLVASIGTSSNVSCNGGSDGSATASGAGGTAPYSYGWSGGGGSSATASGLSAGTYTVTVTDANGCTDTESVTITQPTALVASIGSSTNVSCNGGADGAATASGSGGTSPYSFAWSGGGGSSASATGLSAGTYTVTITDANGCTDTESITITQPATLVASISSSTNVSCNGGSDGSATASGAGGTTPYSYAWSGGGGSSATASGLPAGTYTVTITDANGCTDTESITITQPATAVSASIALGQNVSCNGGSDGAATASGAGGTSPYTFAWSGGAGSSASASGLSAGTYTVTVTDANGCTDTETITITQPTVLSASAVNDSVSCNGGSDGTATVSASGGTTPYTYAWSGGGGSSATATGLSAGSYTVTVTDANGCTTTASTTVGEPTAIIVSLSATNVSCNGAGDGSITASVSGGTAAYSYNWSTAATISSVTNLGPGTYTVTVTDANGCTETASATITQPSALSASASVNNHVSCNGGSDGSATASGSGGTTPYSYAWSGGGGSSATATGLSAGTYTVTITDANGCTDNASVTITEPTVLTISATVDSNTTCASSATGVATATAGGGTSPYSFEWSNSQTNATATNLGTGSYSVTVTDANGCEAFTSITIVVEDTIDPVVTTQNITTYLDASGNAVISSSDVDNGTSDDCGLASLSLNDSVFDCSDVGSPVTVTLTAMDVNGNSSSETAVVTVMDTVSPNAVAVNSIVLYLDASGSASTSSFEVDSASTDACGIASISLNDSVFDCSDAGTSVTVTLSVIDVHGNTSSDDISVIILDTVSPNVITQNVTVYLDAVGSASISTSMINNGTSDACGIDTMMLSQSSFACADTGFNTITLTAVDVNGNVDSATALVTVLDTTAPVLVATDTTVYLDSNGTWTIDVNYIDVGSYDNCDIDTMWLSEYTFNCADTAAPQSVTFYAKDISGNVSSGAYTVTVMDTIAPDIAIVDTILYLNASGLATITASQIDNGTSDNCALASISLTQTSFSCADTGVNVVQFIATDISGNQSTQNAIITVIDTLDPLITAAPMTVYLDASGNASITTSQAVTFTNDNCGIDTVWLSTYNFTCADIGSNSVTASILDESGNLNSDGFTVTVLDTTGPSVSTSNATVYLDSAGEAVIDTSHVFSGATDNCEVDSIWLSTQLFTCADTGVNVVWVYGSDVNGNIDSTVAFVTVIDTIAPAVQAFPTVYAYANTSGVAYLTVSMFDDGSFDNCALDSLWITTDSLTCLNGNGSHVTLYGVDVSGNVSMDSSMVIIVDTTLNVEVAFASDSVCQGELVGLTALPTGGVYSGTLAGYITNDTLNTDSISGWHAIVYTYTNASGCSDVATDSIYIVPSPEVVFSQTTFDLCGGDSLNTSFASPAGGTMISQFLFDGKIVAPDTSYNGIGGIYYYENSCGSDTDTFYINVSPIPVVDLGSDTLLCNATQFSLNAGEHASYLWSTGETTASILLNNGEQPVMEAFSVWVEVTNEAGCSASDTINIDVEDQPTFYLGDNIYACIDSVIVLSVPAVYDNFVWSDFSTGTSIIAHDGSLTPPGDYQFWVEGSNDGAECRFADTILIRLLDCDSVFVGLDETELEIGFEVYPNPAHQVLNIRTQGLNVEEMKQLTIIGSMGEIVQRFGKADWNVISTSGELSIELGSMASGVYLLRMDHEKGTATTRLVVGR